MSKKLRRRSPAGKPSPEFTISVADLAEANREEVQRKSDWASRLERVDPQLLAAIDQAGPLRLENSIRDDAVALVAERLFNGQDERAIINAFEARLQAAGVDVWIAAKNDPEFRRALQDVAFGYAQTFADAGFLLGYAIGRGGGR